MTLKAVQFANTLDISDGGPARNAFEVNVALNDLPDVSVQMFWMRGTFETSVAAEELRAGARTSPLRGNLSTVWKALRGCDVVIIHGFYLLWIPIVVAACRALGVPYVIMPHGVFTTFQRELSRNRKRTFDAVAGRSIRRAAATFCVATHGERDELLEFDPRARVTITGVGTTPARSIAAGELHSPVRLISMSRLAPKKRIDVAIRTVAALGDRGVVATLEVAGTGDSEMLDTLRGVARSFDVEGSVAFAGAVTGADKTDLLTRGDIFLAPSEDENFGIAVAEALAHGLPVVATRRVNAAAVADGVAGAVIDGPSPEQAADRIERLISEPDFASMRARAVEIARVHYSWPAVALKWRDTLLAVASAGRRRR